jgi:hypothetical protein
MADRAYVGNIDLVEKGKTPEVLRNLVALLQLTSLPAYANNAAAIAGGLAAGDLYRTNADPDTICVVH